MKTLSNARKSQRIAQLLLDEMTKNTLPLRHWIETETRRCECGAPACHDCLRCSSTCDCATKVENTPVRALQLDGAFANERFTGEME